MGKHVVKNLSFYLGALKLASNVNALDFAAEAAVEDVTNGASGGWFEGLQGQRKMDLGVDPIWLEDVADPEATLNAAIIGATAAPFTGTKTNPAVQGDVAYFQKVTQVYFTRRAQVGKAWGGSLRTAAASPAIRGRVLENVVRTVTGNSAAFNLGVAVGANERLWFAIHVVAFDGTSLDLKYQSDDGAGFGTPIDRLTLATLTGVGFDFQVIDGPITDTYWRTNATFVGTSVEYLTVFGIGPKV
jgi:hypothetical protein